MLRTRIVWNLHDFCSGGCDYCPDMFKNGSIPQEFSMYMGVAKQLIDHYTSLGRTIDWIFNGGEPLEMFDLPELLKFCRIENSTIRLITNGGKLWLDWWALEPHINSLNLTVHHWQNFNLIRFIIQLFLRKNKDLNVSVPIRPTHFDEDILTVEKIKNEFGIHVTKQMLYHHAVEEGGHIGYSNNQYENLTGIKISDTSRITFKERSELINNVSPIFQGQQCNAGIEVLHIGHTGWVKGSMCNNTPLGNIWKGINLPVDPQTCGMQSCVYPEDQKITKLD